MGAIKLVHTTYSHVYGQTTYIYKCEDYDYVRRIMADGKEAPNND